MQAIAAEDVPDRVRSRGIRYSKIFISTLQQSRRPRAQHGKGSGGFDLSYLLDPHLRIGEPSYAVEVVQIHAEYL